ncbi:MAG: addiction module protein [Planctomycetota bacterium]
MSTEPQAIIDFQQIANRVLSLPVEQRLELAHKLWESIEPPGQREDEVLVELLDRRDRELSEGVVQPIEHDEAIRLAREHLRQRRCE